MLSSNGGGSEDGDAKALMDNPETPLSVNALILACNALENLVNIQFNFLNVLKGWNFIQLPSYLQSWHFWVSLSKKRNFKPEGPKMRSNFWDAMQW